MKLNCDLGESYGAWQMGQDEWIMPYIDMANIACGFHGGDPLVMQKTLEFAKQHNVQIGAHPSYPDRQGFGRRSMVLSRAELIAILHYQIASLDGMAAIQEMSLSYVKPHGALYNDMMQDESIFIGVLQALASYTRVLPLVIQATAKWQIHAEMAANYNLPLMFEAFADRCYQDNGALVSRNQSGAVLNSDQVMAQVKQLIEQNSVTTNSGKTLSIKADTLCVHGDTPDALACVKRIRQEFFHNKLDFT